MGVVFVFEWAGSEVEEFEFEGDGGRDGAFGIPFGWRESDCTIGRSTE